MTGDAKVALDFLEIQRRLATCPLPEIDLVVGIATGGSVPAALLAYRLERPLATLAINYRDPSNSPRYPAPKLLAAPNLDRTLQRILLVDDVSVSGKTLSLARAQLEGHTVSTLVLKGRADIVLFPEVASCVLWPWKAA